MLMSALCLNSKVILKVPVRLSRYHEVNGQVLGLISPVFFTSSPNLNIFQSDISVGCNPLLWLSKCQVYEVLLHIWVESFPWQMRDIINVLVYCIIIERKSPQDTQMIRSLACNVLLQVRIWNYLDFDHCIFLSTKCSFFQKVRFQNHPVSCIPSIESFHTFQGILYLVQQELGQGCLYFTLRVFSERLLWAISLGGCHVRPGDS